MPTRNKGLNRFDISRTLKSKRNEKPHGLSVISSSSRYPEYIRKSTGGEVNISLLKEETRNKITEGVKLELGPEEIEVKLFDIKHESFERKTKCMNEGGPLSGKKSVFVASREPHSDHGDTKRDVALLIDGTAISGEKKCKICNKKVCGGIVICLTVILITAVVLLATLV